MPAEQEIQRLKSRIAEVYAHREQLKRALEIGALPPRAGFTQLEQTDRELSALDTRFKTLWDAAQSAPHPAARWAAETTLEPIQLDCVTAIMLKILDAKCKMGEAEKTALAAVYDVVGSRPGEQLGAEARDLIARVRAGKAGLGDQVHTWRLRAEAAIPKAVMKAFKARLRADLPLS